MAAGPAEPREATGGALLTGAALGATGIERAEAQRPSAKAGVPATAREPGALELAAATAGAQVSVRTATTAPGKTEASLASVIVRVAPREMTEPAVPATAREPGALELAAATADAQPNARAATTGREKTGDRAATANEATGQAHEESRGAFPNRA
jgi:hypothetical protein